MLVVLAAGSARADDGATPRSIGRAGTGAASEDGGGALLVNPAGLARRDTTRIQLGATAVDDGLDWRPTDPSAPIARDQSASNLLPQIAAEGEVAGFVIAIAAQTASAFTRTFASPNDYPADQLANRFDYRYAGIAGALRRDVVSIGAARRIGESVALGLALGGQRVGLDVTRSVWADSVLGRAIDPNHDIAVAVSATGYSPTAIAGVLVAPPDSRVELAASLAYAGAVSLDGSYTTADPKAGMNPPGVSARYDSPSARLELHQPVTARAAARWVGDRWIGELEADAWLYADAAQAPTWELSGLSVTDTANGATAPIARLPSRASTQSHGALRAALDVELIAGFLWATGGYAFTGAGTDATRLSPTFGQLAGHTGALGLEISGGGFTVALGWARTWSLSRATPAPTSAWLHDDPFPVTDSSVPAGRYRTSSDLVGISIDAELGAQP